MYLEHVFQLKLQLAGFRACALNLTPGAATPGRAPLVVIADDDVPHVEGVGLEEQFVCLVEAGSGHTSRCPHRSPLTLSIMREDVRSSHNDAIWNPVLRTVPFGAM